MGPDRLWSPCNDESNNARGVQALVPPNQANLLVCCELSGYPQRKSHGDVHAALAIVSISEIWIAIQTGGDPSAYTLAATICASLAGLGPGTRSVDTHLFGRRRISIGTNKRNLPRDAPQGTGCDEHWIHLNG